MILIGVVMKFKITNLLIPSPHLLVHAGHLWTESTNTGCNQWLSLAKIALKVPHAGRNRSLVANTNRCGEGISLHYIFYGPGNKVRIMGPLFPYLFSPKVRGLNLLTFLIRTDNGKTRVYKRLEYVFEICQPLKT